MIDWMSRIQPNCFELKPVAIISVAASIGGGTRCQYELRKMLVYFNCAVLNRPEVFIGQNYLKFKTDIYENMELVDEKSMNEIKL